MAALKVTNWRAVLGLTTIIERRDLLEIMGTFFDHASVLLARDRELLRGLKQIQDLLEMPGGSVEDCFGSLVRFPCLPGPVFEAFPRKREAKVAHESPPDSSAARFSKLEPVRAQTDLPQTTRSPSTQTSQSLGSQSEEGSNGHAGIILFCVVHAFSEIIRSVYELGWRNGNSAARGQIPVVHDVGTSTVSADSSGPENTDGAPLREFDDIATGEDLVSSTGPEEHRPSFGSGNVSQSSRIGLMEGFSMCDDDAVNISHMSDAELYRKLMLDVPFGEPIDEMVDESDNLA